MITDAFDVAADEIGHHGGVDDAQAIDTEDLENIRNGRRANLA
jgi:hypothetical protein